MDIHRCRFVPFPSSAVNALSFSHNINAGKSKTRAPTTLRLALGRANGDIEIWNPSNGQWVQETIIRGGKDRSIEALAWIEDPQDVDKHGRRTPGKLRLFSIGYSEAVTEWDLAAGKPLRHSSGNHGEIWCMASQPKGALPEKMASRSEDEQRDLENQAQTQCIAVGCADGSIVILSPSDEELRFQRVLAKPGKRKSRVLSVVFQNRYTVVAGHADSTIRIYDIRGGQPIRTMTLGAGPKNGPSETLVWAVKCLKDGTIVSGDSNGEVRFWDGKIYALTQRIKSHEADVLDIAVGADGRTIFSGGIDRRTCTYQRVTQEDSGGRRTRWVKSSHVRIHRNDVKAMASYEAKNLSILASGGLDSSLSLVPIEKSNEEYYRTLSGLPQRRPIASAPSQRLLVTWWDREVRIWTVTRTTALDDTMDCSNVALDTDGRKLVAKLLLQGDETITAADITSDGQLLAVSTMADTKFFQLQAQDLALKVRRLTVPGAWGKVGARIVHFAPDGRWVVLMSPENAVIVGRLEPSIQRKGELHAHPRILKLSRFARSLFTGEPHHGTLGKYMRSINQVSFSSDSRILAVSDLSGFIDTWLLEGNEDLADPSEAEVDSDNESSVDSDSDSDSDNNDAKPRTVLGQQWIRNPVGNLIPRFNKVPTVLSFRPAVLPPPQPTTNGVNGIHNSPPPAEDRLLVVTSDNFMAEYHVLSGSLTTWSRRNPIKIFPNDYRILRDPAKGLIWDTYTPFKNRVWVYGISWLWMFDLSQDFPLPDDAAANKNSGTSPEHAQSSKSQRRHQNELSQLASLKRKRERGTGAGGTRKAGELNTGFATTVKRIDGAGPVRDREVISADTANATHNDDDDLLSDADSDVGYNHSLLLKRRNATAAAGMGLDGAAESKEEGDEDAMDIDTPLEAQANGINDDDDDDDGEIAPQHVNKQEREARAVEKVGKGPMTWHSFKYRPILGIVPIGEPTASGGVEVALIERPEWEAEEDEGVGRWVGNQEWDP